MAFPTDPLGVMVELRAGHQWLEITDDVRTRDVVTLTGGRADEAAQADASKCTLTLNNRDGRYSPRNPRSPLYGLIGRNTPVRVSVRAGPAHLDLDGDPANYAATPSTAALNVGGDIDVRAEVGIDWRTQTANQAVIAKWDPAGDQRSWMLKVLGGELRFYWSGNGTTSTYMYWPLPNLPHRAAIRATIAANELGGATVTLYWAASLEGPWHKLGDYHHPTPVNIFASTAPLRLGGSDPTTGLPRIPYVGEGHRFEVRAGVDGPLMAAPDFRQLAPGTREFTDAAGVPWTLEGAAVVSHRNVRFTGEVSTWPPRWDTSGQDVWVPVEAAGILRRLGQGAKPLESTLRRRVPSAPELVAYWPMEEDRGATQAYSPVPGVAPMQLRGAEFGAVDTLPSSSPLPKLGKHVLLRARVPPAATAGEWQVEFVYFADGKAPAAETELLSIHTTGSIARWKLTMAQGVARVHGYDADDIERINQGVFIGEDVFTQWTRQRFSVAPAAGGGSRWVIAWQDVGGGTGYLDGPAPGSGGHVAALYSGFGEEMDGWALGHVAVFDTENVSVMTGSDSAYAGETVWDRMTRLSREETLPLGLTGDPKDTPAMGAQRPETLLALLEQAAEVDGGILAEQRESLALAYRSRTSLYNQAPALVLDYAARGELMPPLEPVDDDQRLRNDVTVSRSGGSTARALLEEGPLSIQPPPAGVGRYDESLTLNLARDDQTDAHAGWRLHLGTIDELRFPTVTIKLEGAPHLTDAVLGLQAGDKVRLKNLPEWLPAAETDLILEGWTEDLATYSWQVSLSCSPAAPWTVGVLEDPTQGRVDTDGTQLATDADATDTALTIQATTGPAWVTAAAPLNPNPDFETGLSGWTGTGAALQRVPAPEPAPTGSPWAMQITPDGAAQYPSAGSDMIPVTPGAAYTVCGWLMSATERPIDLNVNWFGSEAAYLATSNGHTQTPPADTWVWFEGTVTAPAGAVTANIAPTIPDYPTPAEVVWAGLATLRPALTGALPSEFPFDVAVGGETVTVDGITGSGPQTMTVRRAVNGISLPHTAGADVRLVQPAVVAL